MRRRGARIAGVLPALVVVVAAIVVQAQRRTFETQDEYFDYYRRYHAFWKMYGMGLPDDVLRKVCYRNALEVVPAIDRSLFPAP